MSMLGGITLSGQAQDGIAGLSQAIEQFTLAGDEQNAAALEALLHADYRVVWNQLDKGTLIALDRAAYLQMIKDKKFGGDKRSVHIESIQWIDGGNALVKATLRGAKADFESLFSLVKNQKGEWLIVQDQVFMAVK